MSYCLLYFLGVLIAGGSFMWLVYFTKTDENFSDVHIITATLVFSLSSWFGVLLEILGFIFISALVVLKKSRN